MSPNIPIIDTVNFRENLSECKKAVESFEKYGVMIIKDPRVDQKKNSDFIDQMEKYYEQAGQKFYNGELLTDAKPESGYNIGLVPEGMETARNHKHTIDKKFNNQRPLTQQPPQCDKKWRFSWNVDENILDKQGVLGDNVVPKGFEDVWADTMNGWGHLMLGSVKTAAEMLARGYEIDPGHFRDRMEGSTHLLAPTGSDLSKYNEVGTVLAGFHYDLSFISIHGKSRFPGLYIWLRDGTKLQIKVPEGCLLLQAAKQLEHQTGGQIFAGFHEVVVNEDTLIAIEKAKKEGRSLWRVSSTMFSSIRYDEMLQPELLFANEESLKAYPPILTYKHVQEELKAIGLFKEN